MGIATKTKVALALRLMMEVCVKVSLRLGLMKDTKTKSMTRRKWQICLALAALTPTLAIVAAVGAVLWLGNDDDQSKSLSSSNRQYSRLVMVAKIECLRKKSKAFNDVLNADKVSLVQQQASMAVPQLAQTIEQKLWPAFGSYNDVYQGLSYFGGYLGDEFDMKFNQVFPKITPPFLILDGLRYSCFDRCLKLQRNISDWSQTTKSFHSCIQEK